jgi:hypothetical protein
VGDELQRSGDCGENCVGLKPKQAVIGAYRLKSNGLRSAVNVSKCGHNVTGALLGCRFHNPKVGGSIPPPATRISQYFNNLEARSLNATLLLSRGFAEDEKAFAQKSAFLAVTLSIKSIT